MKLFVNKNVQYDTHSAGLLFVNKFKLDEFLLRWVRLFTIVKAAAAKVTCNDVSFWSYVVVLLDYPNCSAYRRSYVAASAADVISCIDCASTRQSCPLSKLIKTIEPLQQSCTPAPQWWPHGPRHATPIIAVLADYTDVTLTMLHL